MKFRAARAFIRDDRGQGLAEYALIIALVAMVALTALRVLGGKAKNELNNAAANLS